MAYTSAAEIARIEALIATKIAQLALANTTYSALLANDIEEYRFDSGEGSQRARRVKLKEFKDQIDSLQSEIDTLNRRLRAGGLNSIVLRRQ